MGLLAVRFLLRATRDLLFRFDRFTRAIAWRARHHLGIALEHVHLPAIAVRVLRPDLVLLRVTAGGVHPV